MKNYIVFEKNRYGYVFRHYVAGKLFQTIKQKDLEGAMQFLNFYQLTNNKIVFKTNL